MTPGPEGPEDGPRRGGPALEAMYGLTLWLIPTLERFPRRQKFLLGDRIQSTAVASLESLSEATFTRRLDEVGRLVGGWKRTHRAASG